MHAKRCLDAIDKMIADRHLLKHPFYQAWTAGELPLPALQDYARQYYRQVDAFPRYLGGVYSKTKDAAARRLVLRNILEEDSGPENHPELWLRFAEGLGVSRDDVQSAQAFDETERTVATFERLCLRNGPECGMAALYAYEAMVPEVAEAKIDGLKKFYDIDDTRTLQFFAVHEEADREHREWDKQILASLVRDEQTEKNAIEATEAGLAALWQILDGVAQRHNICA
ncbi:MAG: CADD family putative folate metabolism protein [Deltaproteobacteria bacterium]|nr:CADD family putative folate metabolism protein [Deltaproteobacteria bacterium]